MLQTVTAPSLLLRNSTLQSLGAAMLCGLVLLLMPATVHAQRGTVEGRVLDAETDRKSVV